MLKYNVTPETVKIFMKRELTDNMYCISVKSIGQNLDPSSDMHSHSIPSLKRYIRLDNSRVLDDTYKRLFLGLLVIQ